MKQIRIKLNIPLHGHPKDSIIFVDPTDPYWADRLKETENNDLIEILAEDPPPVVKKSQSTKSKEIKT